MSNQDDAARSPRPAAERSFGDLLAGLDTALRAYGGDWGGRTLEPMRDKGLAHDHVRILGTGAIARIPKQSQMDLPAAENLAYQATCFRRAAASGHTPRLLGVLAPSAELPRGGLLVEEIEGRVARLPDDLPAIAVALAGIHALQLPAPAARGPLRDPADPLAALLAEIRVQARHLQAAQLPSRPRQLVEAEIARLRALCLAADRPEKRLISFDAHPGNFVVRADGRAVLVDLEKARYGYPSLDLAHATLYTSTTWDVDICVALDCPAIIGAYDSWAAAIGSDAAGSRRWHVPLRRAMWLWSVTWCAKWRVLSAAAPKPAAAGEDWSAEASDAALIAHVRDRVDHYLSHAIIARNFAEFAALDAEFGA